MPKRNPVMTSSRVVNHAIGLAPARRGLAAGTSGMRCRRHGAECGNPLMCAPKRSAEEFVAEDWVAVAEAITGRMRELKLSQRDLAVHSNVSVATIREIQRHRIKRRREPPPGFPPPGPGLVGREAEPVQAHERRVPARP